MACFYYEVEKYNSVKEQRMKVFTDTLSANKKLFEDKVYVNKKLFVDSRWQRKAIYR